MLHSKLGRFSQENDAAALSVVGLGSHRFHWPSPSAWLLEQWLEPNPSLEFLTFGTHQMNILHKASTGLFSTIQPHCASRGFGMYGQSFWMGQRLSTVGLRRHLFSVSKLYSVCSKMNGETARISGSWRSR